MAIEIGKIEITAIDDNEWIQQRQAMESQWLKQQELLRQEVLAECKELIRLQLLRLNER